MDANASRGFFSKAWWQQRRKHIFFKGLQDWRNPACVLQRGIHSYQWGISTAQTASSGMRVCTYMQNLLCLIRVKAVKKLDEDLPQLSGSSSIFPWLILFQFLCPPFLCFFFFPFPFHPTLCSPNGLASFSAFNSPFSFRPFPHNSCSYLAYLM